MTQDNRQPRAVSAYRNILPRKVNSRFTVRLYMFGHLDYDGQRRNTALFWSCGRLLDSHEEELHRAREYAVQLLRRGHADRFHIVEARD